MADDYETYSLPKLLDFIKNLGQPATLQTAEANWEGIAGELIRRIGLSNADSATLNGLVAAVAPHWKGSGADAYGQHVNDLSTYGVDVADRAYLTNYGAPSSNFATFHSATDDALTALTYVKQQAAQIVPLTDDNAKSAYLNSLTPQDRAAVEMPSRFPNPAREQAIQQAVTTYQTSYNEALRQQALQLLNVLGAAYTSIADNLPTKAPGNSPAPHDTSTAVSPNSVASRLGAGWRHRVSRPRADGPDHRRSGPGRDRPHPGRFRPVSCPVPSRSLRRRRMGRWPSGPTVPRPASRRRCPRHRAHIHWPPPLLPSVPAGTLPAGLDPTTQLANFTPSGVGCGTRSRARGQRPRPIRLGAHGHCAWTGESARAVRLVRCWSSRRRPGRSHRRAGCSRAPLPGGILPGGLAAAGLRRWRRRPGSSGRWLAIRRWRSGPAGSRGLGVGRVRAGRGPGRRRSGRRRPRGCGS